MWLWSPALTNPVLFMTMFTVSPSSGPNYKAGLQLMRDLGNNLDIPIEVYGPETNMTHIVDLGIRWIKEGI